MKLIKSVKDVCFRTFPGGDMFSVLVGRHESSGSSEHHTVAIVKLPVGCESDEHYHREREESYYFIEGEGVAFIDSKEVVVKAGSLVYIKALERHKFKNTGNIEMSYLIITAPTWIPEDSHR